MENTQYYISRDNGPQEGPFTLNQLGLYISTARLRESDLIWREGLTNWQSCGSLPEIAELYVRTPPPPPQNSVPVPRPVTDAGFGLRLVACLIDFAALLVVLLPLSFVFTIIQAAVGEGGLGHLMDPQPYDPADPLGIQKMNGPQLIVFFASFAANIFVKWLYYSIFESSRLQGSLGKLALGLKVTDYAGNRISFGRASGRFFGSVISTAVFGLGYFPILITPRRQSLHDLLAQTLVVRK